MKKMNVILMTLGVLALASCGKSTSTSNDISNITDSITSGSSSSTTDTSADTDNETTTIDFELPTLTENSEYNSEEDILIDLANKTVTNNNGYVAIDSDALYILASGTYTLSGDYNGRVVISEEDGKVYLPYTKDEIKKDVSQNKGTKISEIIENKYILPLDKYKNSMRARFREGYNLMYYREKKSKRSAIMLGIELMFESNLHPAIISACKTLEELDIYLDCLEDNELEKFSCFKIIYKSLPTLHKNNKAQEF